MVIMLSFNLSKEGILNIYFVKIWNKDIRYNILPCRPFDNCRKIEANCANMFQMVSEPRKESFNMQTYMTY